MPQMSSLFELKWNLMKSFKCFVKLKTRLKYWKWVSISQEFVVTVVESVGHSLHVHWPQSCLIAKCIDDLSIICIITVCFTLSCNWAQLWPQVWSQAICNVQNQRLIFLQMLIKLNASEMKWIAKWAKVVAIWMQWCKLAIRALQWFNHY